jgi:plastocyanin
MRSFHKKTLVAMIFTFGLLSAPLCRAGEIKGKVSVHGIPSAKNIAVYVDAIPGKTFDAPSKHTSMDQKNLKFVPHILVVLKGTTVDFLNSDATLHNVFWPDISGNRKLAGNLGTWPQGQKKSFTFDNVGVASLLCNVHQEMSGYVVVVSTPYFAVTDEDGSYIIKDVPAGHYTLKTWSEEGKPTTASIEVPSGTATLDLAVRR